MTVFFYVPPLQPMFCSNLHPVQTFWVNCRLKTWVQLLYTVTTYRECNEKRGFIACFGFRKNVSAAFFFVPGCAGSLQMTLSCPCTWYYPVPAMILPYPCTWHYPVPAHEITPSLHMILPYPCTWYYPVPAHYIILSLHIILPVPAHDITLSLHMIVPCPCTRYYPVPAHDSTLSLHMILPCSCTYYPVPAHDITLSLHMIVPYPCTWYYPVTEHDITLSLHVILPYPCTWYCPILISGCAVFLCMAVPCLEVHEIQVMMTLSFLSNIVSGSRD